MVVNGVWSKLLSWFREECPYCGQRLVLQESDLSSIAKQCPDGHYLLETHPVLHVQVEHHRVIDEKLP